MSAHLYARPPWTAHDFPEKRITRKVCKASRPYCCEAIGPAPGHVPTIETGATYLRVAVRPPKYGSGKWRQIRLCRACGIHFGLATTSAELLGTEGAPS